MELELINDLTSEGLQKANELNYTLVSDLITKIISGKLDSEVDDMEDWIEGLNYRMLYSLIHTIEDMTKIVGVDIINDETADILDRSKDVISLVQCLYRFENGSMDGFDGEEGNDLILELEDACWLELGKRRGKIEPGTRLSDIYTR